MELNALSHHEQALRFRSLRNEVLASNIANADTPGYKARDIEFSSVLKSAQGEGMRMRATSELHQGASSQSYSSNWIADAKYRVPTQPSLDGNTVQSDVEQAQFAENALMYRASLSFMDGYIKTLKYALRGGD